MRRINLARSGTAASERDPHDLHVPGPSEPSVWEALTPMVICPSPEEADAMAATAVAGEICVVGLQGRWQFCGDWLNKVPFEGRAVFLAFEPGEPEPTPQHVFGWKLKRRGARVFNAHDESEKSEPVNRSFQSPFEKKDGYLRRGRRGA